MVKGIPWCAAGALALGACADPTGVRGAGGTESGVRHLEPAFEGAFEITVTELSARGLTQIPVDINNRGEIVGYCLDREFPPAGLGIGGHAFLFSPAGFMHDLGTRGGARSCAAAINDLGQVVGYSETASGALHAFVWQDGVGMRDLGTLPGGTESRALDISNRGEIVGWNTNAKGRQRAVLWSPAGWIHDLGTLPPLGGLQPVVNQATTINDARQVVGWQRGGFPATWGTQKMFLWTGTDRHDLPAPASGLRCG